MKMTYGERLKAARARKGLSQTQLEELSGVKQASISKIERGDQDSSAFDIDLALALDINPMWLKTGDERFAPAWLLMPEMAIKETLIDKNNKLRHVPVVGTAQLGDNSYWCDMNYPAGFGDGYIKFPTDDKDAYALRCVGDSMRPRIKNGEYVIIEPNMMANSGDEVLIKAHDGRVMIKTLLYERDGYIYLQSINEMHPSFSLSRDEIAAIHPVVAVIKNARWIKY